MVTNISEPLKVSQVKSGLVAFAGKVIGGLGLGLESGSGLVDEDRVIADNDWRWVGWRWMDRWRRWGLASGWWRMKNGWGRWGHSTGVIRSRSCNNYGGGHYIWVGTNWGTIGEELLEVTDWLTANNVEFVAIEVVFDVVDSCHRFSPPLRKNSFYNFQSCCIGSMSSSACKDWAADTAAFTRRSTTQTKRTLCSPVGSCVVWYKNEYCN